MAKLKRVKVDDLYDALQEVLSEELDYVDQTVVKDAIHQTAEETAADVRAGAPEKTGAYKDSITAGSAKRRGHTYSETVYASIYRLPHLLERPHATRNGGRTAGKPHWAPAAEKIRERLIKHIKEGLG